MQKMSTISFPSALILSITLGMAEARSPRYEDVYDEALREGWTCVAFEKRPFIVPEDGGERRLEPLSAGGGADGSVGIDMDPPHPQALALQGLALETTDRQDERPATANGQEAALEMGVLSNPTASEVMSLHLLFEESEGGVTENTHRIFVGTGEDFEKAARMGISRTWPEFFYETLKRGAINTGLGAAVFGEWFAKRCVAFALAYQKGHATAELMIGGVTAVIYPFNPAIAVGFSQVATAVNNGSDWVPGGSIARGVLLTPVVDTLITPVTDNVVKPVLGKMWQFTKWMGGKFFKASQPYFQAAGRNIKATVVATGVAIGNHVTWAAGVTRDALVAFVRDVRKSVASATQRATHREPLLDLETL